MEALGLRIFSAAKAPSLEDNAWPGARYQNDSAVTIDDVAIDVLDIKIIRILGSTAGEGYTTLSSSTCRVREVRRKGHICVFNRRLPLNGPNKVGEIRPWRLQLP